MSHPDIVACESNSASTTRTEVEADSLRPKSDPVSPSGSCDPRSRRCELAQRPRREAERDVRQVAIRYIDQASQRGVPASVVAQQLRAPARTVRHWKSQGAGPISSRGRRPKTCPIAQRNEVIRFLNEVSGPVVGLEALRALFTTVPRCILDNLLRRYRRIWRWRYVQNGFRLSWLGVGSTWAMDFSKATHPIDGIYPYLFAVRDLASHYQLAWHPFRGETALETIAVLVDLFGRFGPPLVLKSDNGPAFVAEILAAVLQDWGVSQLFSPPYHPQYNGALERSNGTLKTYTHQHAIHEGHPFRWTSADVNRARELANTLTRPWGHLGESPEQAWQTRPAITAEERELFLATVTIERLKATSEMTSADITEPHHRIVQADIDRRAISQSLQELNYLEMTRVTRPPNKPRRRSRAELAERARRRGMPESLTRSLTTSPLATAVLNSLPARIDLTLDEAHDQAPASANDCQSPSFCEAMPIPSTAPLTISAPQAQPGKKPSTSLAMLQPSDTMSEQHDVGALHMPAPTSPAARVERSNTSWLRRCLTLIIRLAKVAKISCV